MAEGSFENLGPRWYVAHTYTGYENKVMANLEKIIENRSLQHLIFDIKVPVETVIETVNGQEKQVENKIFPAYVFVKMIMTDESRHVVRNISGVTGFVGPGSKPVPITDEEAARMGVEIKVISLSYNVGDSVKIVSGPLAQHNCFGIVQAISDDKKKVTVLASVFGRETPVELDTDQVELV